MLPTLRAFCLPLAMLVTTVQTVKANDYHDGFWLFSTHPDISNTIDFTKFVIPEQYLKMMDTCNFAVINSDGNHPVKLRSPFRVVTLKDIEQNQKIMRELECALLQFQNG